MELSKLTSLVEKHIQRALTSAEPLDFSERQLRSGLAYGALGIWNDLAAVELSDSELVAKREHLEAKLKELFWALPQA